MALFDNKAKKAAEEAAKKAKAAEYLARLEKNKAVVAKEKAEKELKDLKAAKVRRDLIAKRKAMQAGRKPAAGLSKGPAFGGAGMPGGIGPFSAKASGIIASYTVKKGDTLSQIAKNYYGSGSSQYWKLIQEANKDIIKDANLIKPGQVFKIPVLPESLKKK